MNTRTMTMTAAAAVLSIAGGSAGATEFARVVSATPVLAQVGVPQRECVEVQRIVQPQPSGVGALLGAVVGGVVGHQIGGGSGRAVATGIGVVAGAVTGNQIESNNSYPTSYPGQSCRTVTTSQNRVIGYDVVYEYNGQRYTTRTAGDPGSRLAIDVLPARSQREDGYGQGRPVPPVDSYSAVPPTYVESLPPRYVQAAPPVYVQPAVAPVYYEAPYYAPYYAPYDGAYYGRPYRGPAISIGIGVGSYWGGGHWGGGHWNGRHHWSR